MKFRLKFSLCPHGGRADGLAQIPAESERGLQPQRRSAPGTVKPREALIPAALASAPSRLVRRTLALVTLDAPQCRLSPVWAHLPAAMPITALGFEGSANKVAVGIIRDGEVRSFLSFLSFPFSLPLDSHCDSPALLLCLSVPLLDA